MTLFLLGAAWGGALVQLVKWAARSWRGSVPPDPGAPQTWRGTDLLFGPRDDLDTTGRS